MQGRLDLSIGKKYRECIDQVIGMAGVKGVSVSSIICEAVKEYVQKLNNNPNIILSEKHWNLEDKSKDELRELDTLITKLNRSIVRELCRR